MKIRFIHSKSSARAAGGWALLAVLSVTGAAVMILASVMSWANENSTVATRRNEYFTTAYAAEAATEKVLSAMVQDDENYGEGYMLSRLSAYESMIPSASDDPYWTNFAFSGGTNANQVVVTMMNSNDVTLGAPYTGMSSQGFTYEIIANAENTGTMYKIPSAVGQQIVFSQIPMFQFAIFYFDTMEIDPGANMTVTGPVHGNEGIYTYPNPGVTLTFSNIVTGWTLNQTPNPLDPSSRAASPGTIVFDGQHGGGYNPLNMPSGSGTNSMQNGQTILSVPSAGNTTDTSLLYNQAQMIVMVSNNSVTVTSGIANNQATVVPQAQWSQFVSTSSNADFFDQRDGLEVNAVKIDVGNLKTWVATNTSLGVVDSIYVADLRSTSNLVVVTNTTYTSNLVNVTNTTTTSSFPSPGTYTLPVTTNINGSNKTYTYGFISQATDVITNTSYTTNFPITSQPGIVLTNGATLPSSSGLSVATPDPVYILGYWNVSTNGTPVNLGTANTSETFPSAIYADAVTVLSPNWNNADSTQAIGNRTASSDTVNAAFFTGNVPSNGSYYSGGVENFPRFLENWSGQTFTYNGSMVQGLMSRIADYPWPGTGTVYNPPTRNWAFDQNFNNPQKLPPMTPRVTLIQRSAWALVAPGTTQF